MFTLENRQKFEISRALYQLKRDYGANLTYYSVGDVTVDFSTGQQSRELKDYFIRRAIVLSVDVLKKFEYDLSFVAANKNFVYGGIFDRSSRLIVLDAKDLPVGFRYDTEDYIEYSKKRWNIEKITELEFNVGWILKVNAVNVETNNFITTMFFESILKIESEHE
jgi:hypothetical protein